MKMSDKPDLDKLFELLADGQTPDFLQMMAALADVSTIYPEPEPPCEGGRCSTCEM